MPRIEICNRRIETCSRAVHDAPGSAGRDPDDGFVEPLCAHPIVSDQKRRSANVLLDPPRVGVCKPSGFPDAATRPGSPPKIALTTADPFDRRATPLAYPRRRPATLARRKPHVTLFFA